MKSFRRNVSHQPEAVYTPFGAKHFCALRFALCSASPSAPRSNLHSLPCASTDSLRLIIINTECCISSAGGCISSRLCRVYHQRKALHGITPSGGVCPGIVFGKIPSPAAYVQARRSLRRGMRTGRAALCLRVPSSARGSSSGHPR